MPTPGAPVGHQPVGHLPDGHLANEGSAPAGPAASLGGTLVTGVKEAQIVAGGLTLIITLTDDTFLAAGTGPIGSTANTQAIIDGIVSAQSEGTGWNALRSGVTPGDLTRVSDTVASILLPALGSYDITAPESIEVTLPAAALTAGEVVVATPSFGIGLDASGNSVLPFVRRRRR